MTDIKKVKDQARFCLYLMHRLQEDIEGSRESYGAVEKHTVMQKDIIRIRRELHDLYEMLDPYKKF